MATVSELKEVVKETLETRGVLGQVKARIRAEVFNALDDKSEPQPPLSNENLLINELIREYLNFNKYKYSSSVLTAESGMPKVALDREFLKNELHVTEDHHSSSVPLLYGIVAQFLDKNKPPAGGSSLHRTLQGSQGPRAVGQDIDMEPMVIMGGRR